MKCAKVHPNLGAFVLGGLEPQEAAEIQHHLASCPDCRDEVQELEKVTQALEAAPPPIDQPGHLKNEILSRIRAEEPSSPDKELPPSRKLRFLLPAAAAVALVAIVALGIFGLQAKPPLPPPYSYFRPMRTMSIGVWPNSTRNPWETSW